MVSQNQERNEGYWQTDPRWGQNTLFIIVGVFLSVAAYSNNVIKLFNLVTVLNRGCNCIYFSEDIQREEEKVKRSIKDAAKKGQKDVCIILAKEMIHSKKAVNKLYASKAQMNSVLLSMKNQLCECSFYFADPTVCAVSW